MAYATLNDLTDRLTNAEALLLADENSDGQLDEELINNLLEESNATIDHYLQGRYVTPIADPNPVVVGWCADLTIERLYQRRHDAIPNHVNERTALARTTMIAIKDGLVGLAGAIPRAEDYATENLLLDLETVFGHDALYDF